MIRFKAKKLHKSIGWRYKETIITEEYINQHSYNPNLMRLDFPYQMGANVLDVYFNGQRLSTVIKHQEGIGFEEVDDIHIYLHLGHDNTSDSSLLLPLYIEVGDVIIIKQWYGFKSHCYINNLTNQQIAKAETELVYTSERHTNIENRINGIDENILKLLGLGNYTIEYKYNTNTMDIVKEIITGDYNMVMEYKHDSEGNMIRKIIHRGMSKTVHTYFYDESKRCIREDVNTHCMNRYIK